MELIHNVERALCSLYQHIFSIMFVLSHTELFLGFYFNVEDFIVYFQTSIFPSSSVYGDLWIIIKTNFVSFAHSIRIIYSSF